MLQAGELLLRRGGADEDAALPLPAELEQGGELVAVGAAVEVELARQHRRRHLGAIAALAWAHRQAVAPPEIEQAPRPFVSDGEDELRRDDLLAAADRKAKPRILGHHLADRDGVL